ncbi:MAG TPA: response regulator [Patescibacteria group bacterium]|nr:response regulator [Patescibacteria group bacterium]
MTEAKKIADLKTLVVDDHLTARAHMKRLLKNIGVAHVDEAAEAMEVAAQTGAKHYDIIFLDWDMPGKTGVEILRKFRGNTEFDDTAFVMVTAKSEPDDIIAALRAGATSYIVKPADENEVKDNITEVLDWLQQQKALRR